MINIIFEEVKKIFGTAAETIFLIGSASRDLLLAREIKDYDIATSLLPEQVCDILKDFHPDRTFEKYGIIKAKILATTITFATLREEGLYTDSRHPQKINFTTSLEIDSARRDFSINAIYIDCHYNVHDFHGGNDDLHEGIIRMIGDPLLRLQEDPLRILRLFRFAWHYQFEIESELCEVAIDNLSLVKKISAGKLTEELAKFGENEERICELLDEYDF